MIFFARRGFGLTLRLFHGNGNEWTVCVDMCSTSFGCRITEKIIVKIGKRIKERWLE
jgi:hypothetical protein